MIPALINYLYKRPENQSSALHIGLMTALPRV